MGNLKLAIENLNTNLVVAGLAIAVIFILIVYLVTIVVSSYKKRKKAIGISLPKIDGHGANAFTKPEFKEPDKFHVELVDLGEDVPQDSELKDEVAFFTALSVETKKAIANNEDLEMPEVESVDSNTSNLRQEVNR